MRGIRNGSIELAKAFVHGRLDRELEIWAERFSLPSVEFKQNMGALLVGAPGDSMPSAGMHQAAPWAGSHAVATLEVAGGTYGTRTQDGERGNGTVPAAPHQIALPATTRKSPNAWSDLTERERLERSIKSFEKRGNNLIPRHKKMLTTMRTKLALMPPDRKAGKKATKTAAPKARRPRVSDEKQKLYQERHTLRKAGVPEDQLPPLPKSTNAA